MASTDQSLTLKWLRGFAGKEFASAFGMTEMFSLG
jgi:hypothetical protein